MDRLTKKQRQFCHEWTLLHNEREAAVRAGYFHRQAEETAAALLQKKAVEKEILQQESLYHRICSPQELQAALRRVVFGSINDVLRLFLHGEELTDEEIDKLDLFMVAELKRSKDGGMEIKLLDRLKALDMMMQTEGSQQDGITTLLQALDSSASRQEQEEKE